jgi:hypothetical protein
MDRVARGNFVLAAPDAAYTFPAVQKCDLPIQVSTSAGGGVMFEMNIRFFQTPSSRTAIDAW